MNPNPNNTNTWPRIPVHPESLSSDYFPNQDLKKLVDRLFTFLGNTQTLIEPSGKNKLKDKIKINIKILEGDLKLIEDVVDNGLGAYNKDELVTSLKNCLAKYRDLLNLSLFDQEELSSLNKELLTITNSFIHEIVHTSRVCRLPDFKPKEKEIKEVVILSYDIVKSEVLPEGANERIKEEFRKLQGRLISRIRHTVSEYRGFLHSAGGDGDRCVFIDDDEHPGEASKRAVYCGLSILCDTQRFFYSNLINFHKLNARPLRVRILCCGGEVRQNIRLYGDPLVLVGDYESTKLEVSVNSISVFDTVYNNLDDPLKRLFTIRRNFIANRDRRIGGDVYISKSIGCDLATPKIVNKDENGDSYVTRERQRFYAKESDCTLTYNSEKYEASVVDIHREGALISFKNGESNSTVEQLVKESQIGIKFPRFETETRAELVTNSKKISDEVYIHVKFNDLLSEEEERMISG